MFSKFVKISADKIAATVHMNFIILRTPVKFRFIFIKIGAKNDEIDEKIAYCLHFLEMFG